jgi:hypothetical protein
MTTYKIKNGQLGKTNSMTRDKKTKKEWHKDRKRIKIYRTYACITRVAET